MEKAAHVVVVPFLTGSPECGAKGRRKWPQKLLESYETAAGLVLFQNISISILSFFFVAVHK